MRLLRLPHKGSVAVKFEIAYELFAAGMVFGFGPCFLSCAPLILPYIVSKGLDAKSGLLSSVFFSLGRAAAYSALGFISVALLDTLTVRKEIFGRVLGVLILVIVAADLAKGPVKFCAVLGKKYFENIRLNSFAAGVLIGLVPCAPFLGILTYIVAKSPTPPAGLVNGLSFGLGSMFSPLLALGFFAGFVPLAVKNSGKLFSAAKICADLILAYFGLKLLI